MERDCQESVEREKGLWYNRRGMAAFYTIAKEPRPEFVAKGRQTPTVIWLWYNRRGMAVIYITTMEPRPEFAAQGRQTPRAYHVCGTIGVAWQFTILKEKEPRLEFAALGRQTPRAESTIRRGGRE